MKNEKVAARTIRPNSTRQTSTDKSAEDHAPSRLEAAQARRQKYFSEPNKVADHDLSFRNWQVPGAMVLFPQDFKLRTCEIYWPHAKGGPLFMDMPSMDWDVKRCEEKLKVLVKAGVRYTYMKNGETHQHALRRLEENYP